MPRQISEILEELAAHPERPVLLITQKDVVLYAEERGLIEQDVIDHKRSFEKAMEWSALDQVWNVIGDICNDIVQSKCPS